MIHIYIKELEDKKEINGFNRVPRWIKETIIHIMIKINHVIEKQIDENKKIYLIPNIEKEKIYKKIKKKIEKEKTQTQRVEIVLSNKIKKYEKYFENYTIVEGKNVFLELLEKILDKVVKENPIALQDVYILTNRYCEKSVSIIRNLAKKVKTVNVITKEIIKYKNLEEIMQEEAIIYVGNNKKKSLKKAKIIINLDFNKEEIKQYAIFRNAIFINGIKEKITNLNGFEGVIIQDIEVELEENQKTWIEENYLDKSFKKIELYQTLKERGKKNDVIILSLYGNNGKIDEKELRNKQKILTN